MKLYFITSNKNKFREVKAILPNVKRLNILLPEIQDIDAKNVIKMKLKEALKHRKGNFIVEDTSLHMNCLNGLPGPLIIWFVKTMGYKGLYEIAKKMGNNSAKASTLIGYAGKNGEIHFFEDVVKGKIVKPKLKTKFSWDPIFQPEGHNKTFEEMGKEEKNKISMRRKAVEKLKKFLSVSNR